MDGWQFRSSGHGEWDDLKLTSNKNLKFKTNFTPSQGYFVEIWENFWTGTNVELIRYQMDVTNLQ